ncbi:MAG: response regulator transcription factor [bacterium]
MNKKILVIEDDKKLQNVIKAYLESSGYKSEVVGTLKEADSFIEKGLPLLVILDLMLPDGRGEDFIRELKDVADIPVIMVTAKSAEEDKLLGFFLGADDYIVKPFSPRELLVRIKAVLKRYDNDKTNTKETLSFNNGKLIINSDSHEVIVDGKEIELSQTEFKLFLVLAGSPNKVFTRMELVEKALGYQFEGYERTVDAHIKNLRHKIGDESKNPLYIQTVFGIGYKFIGKRDVLND